MKTVVLALDSQPESRILCLAFLGGLFELQMLTLGHGFRVRVLAEGSG